MHRLKRTETRLFLTVFFIYGFYVVMHSPFHNIDALVIAMVDHGTFEIDERIIGDYAVVDGKRYSGYSPGLSWIHAGLYWLLKPICALAPSGLEYQAFTVFAGWLVTIPLGALAVVGLYRLLADRSITHRAALITALAFAFGTMWFVYARRHNNYTYASAVLIFLAFFLIEHAARGPRKGALISLAGFVGVLGVTTDYKSAIALFWVCVYCVLRHRDWRQWLNFGLGAALPAMAMLGYNWHVFGHPLYTPAKFQVENFGGEIDPQAGLIPLVGTTSFHWDWFWKQFFGPRTGFFPYMPVTILAFIGVKFYWPRRAETFPWLWLTTLGMMLSIAYVAANFPYWHGSGSRYFQGPATRYLIPVVPFVMIFVAFAVERIKPAVVYCLLAVSALIVWMFVLSANYGKGESPHAPGWENNPLVVHFGYIARTYGAESVWYKLLSSSHIGLGEKVAALITWCGAAVVGLLVWLVWRKPKLQ